MGDEFGYQGVRVAVTGAASGIGQATARRLAALGAEVVALDINPVALADARYVQVDLTDGASIGRAVGELGGVSRLFNCAGLSGFHPVERVMKTNFLGLRRLTEGLLPAMGDGDAIVGIASLGGLGYDTNQPAVFELLATSDIDDGWAWCLEHPEQFLNGGYTFSKQCLINYTMRECVALAGRQIRINCIAPGPVWTPMLDDSEKALGKEAIAAIPRPLGRNSYPEEQAEVLVWLNSGLASYVNGQIIWTDGGYTSGLATGVYAPLGARR